MNRSWDADGASCSLSLSHSTFARSHLHVHFLPTHIKTVGHAREVNIVSRVVGEFRQEREREREERKLGKTLPSIWNKKNSPVICFRLRRRNDGDGDLHSHLPPCPSQRHLQTPRKKQPERRVGRLSIKPSAAATEAKTAAATLPHPPFASPRRNVPAAAAAGKQPVATSSASVHAVAASSSAFSFPSPPQEPPSSSPSVAASSLAAEAEEWRRARDDAPTPPLMDFNSWQKWR